MEKEGAQLAQEDVIQSRTVTVTLGTRAKKCLENMVGIESPSAHDKAFVRSQMSGTVIKKCPSQLCSHQKCHEYTLTTNLFLVSASLDSPADGNPSFPQGEVGPTSSLPC